jgi:hypothetical protein
MKTYTIERDGYTGAFYSNFTIERMEELALLWKQKGYNSVILKEVKVKQYINKKGQLRFKVLDQVVIKSF